MCACHIIDTPMAHAIEEQPPSRCRQGKQLAALSQASLEHPTPPGVAAVIRNVIESGTWKLRHPAGPDAELFLGWGAAMTDEQWIELNTLDAESIRQRVKNHFGLDIKLPAEEMPRGLASAAD